jgi:hypothetical protein
MSGLRLLVIVAPLRLTVWILAVAAAAIIVLIAIGVSRHLESFEPITDASTSVPHSGDCSRGSSKVGEGGFR